MTQKNPKLTATCETAGRIRLFLEELVDDPSNASIETYDGVLIDNHVVEIYKTVKLTPYLLRHFNNVRGDINVAYDYMILLEDYINCYISRYEVIFTNDKAYVDEILERLDD